MWKRYGAAKDATDDNIIFSIRFVCWINKATNTHPECITSLCLNATLNVHYLAPQPLNLQPI